MPGSHKVHCLIIESPGPVPPKGAAGTCSRRVKIIIILF